MGNCAQFVHLETAWMSDPGHIMDQIFENLHLPFIAPWPKSSERGMVVRNYKIFTKQNKSANKKVMD